MSAKEKELVDQVYAYLTGGGHRKPKEGYKEKIQEIFYQKWRVVVKRGRGSSKVSFWAEGGRNEAVATVS